jgi:hypothetical protein
MTVDAPNAPVVDMPALLKEADAHIASVVAKNGKSNGPAKESAKAVSPGGSEVAKESAKVAEAVKPPAPDAPKAPEVPDLSFVTEEFRPFVEKADPKFVAYLRSLAKEDAEAKLRFADYTKKRMADAEAAKAIEARKVAADFGEQIMSRKELLALVQAKADELDGKATPKFDPVTATPEEWAAHDAAVAKAARDEALAAIRSEQESRTSQVRFRQEMSNAILDSFKGEHEPAEVNDLFVRLGDWAGVKALVERRGVEFSASNVAATLREFLPKKAPAKQDSPPVTETPRSGLTGASALTRGGGIAPTLTLPKHILEGRKAATPQELMAETIHEVNAKRVALGKPQIAV